MRTTIEISNETRAKLMALAAKRGMRGYSEIVNEAIVEYLSKAEDRERDVEAILRLAGTLNEEEDKRMKSRLKEFWSRWQS